ncbi:MAG: pilus assembly protein [Alphaproteobacteria bacterium]|nr:pilus assembly protein [Alphaproteobacteria bacterium]
MMLARSRHWRHDDRGSSAIEFALVAPAFLLLAIGVTYACLLLFTIGSMQYAVEDGARCASVRTAVCSSAQSTVTYAASVYRGPVKSPTFSYAAARCGHQVTGSVNFTFYMVVTTLTVPLSATACYP